MKALLKPIVIIAVLVIMLPVVAADRADGYASNGKALPAALKAFVPTGYRVLDFAQGDINFDSRPEYIVVLDLKHIREYKAGVRPCRLIMLIGRDSTGRNNVIARNKSLLVCRWDAGRSGEDPFSRLSVNERKGSFELTQSIGMEYRCHNQVRFRYSRKQHKWFFAKDTTRCFHVYGKRNVMHTSYLDANRYPEPIPFSRFSHSGARR